MPKHKSIPAISITIAGPCADSPPTDTWMETEPSGQMSLRSIVPQTFSKYGPGTKPKARASFGETAVTSELVLMIARTRWPSHSTMMETMLPKSPADSESNEGNAVASGEDGLTLMFARIIIHY